MSILGISCDPICEHGVHIARQMCRECELQRQFNALTDMYKSLSIQVAAHHEHKIRQIDENRKISRRVDELEKELEIHKTALTRKWQANSELSKRVDELEKVINYISKHTNDENVNKRRIDELEASYKADYETAREIIFAGAQTHASVLKCEAKIKELESSDYDERISDLEKIGVESRLLKMESGNSKKPHTCPVCGGRGATYEFSPPLKCNPCNGKGIVWG
ncbi:MAG: hypothetical protein ACHQ1D_02980 [Nitrososphaerales archaeon]